MNIFSKSRITEDMYNWFDVPKYSWISDDKDSIICDGSGVRFKIEGWIVEQGNIATI